MTGGGQKKEFKKVNMIDVLYAKMNIEFLNLLKPPQRTKGERRKIAEMKLFRL
jgi:hypothetical protein